MARSTEAYRAEVDPIRDFLEDRCVLSDHAWVSVTALRKAYEEWCEQVGEHPLGARAFNDRVRSKGCEQDRRRLGGHLVRGWAGVGLSSEVTA